MFSLSYDTEHAVARANVELTLWAFGWRKCRKDLCGNASGSECSGDPTDAHVSPNMEKQQV